MKEFIEKLIGRLEEHKTKAYVTGITNNPYEFGACQAMDDAVKIINQLAEEYQNDNLSQLSNKYWKCLTKFGVDITEKWETATQNAVALEQAYIRGRQDERDRFAKWQEEHNNGWIPCIERLPEDDSICIVTVEYPNNETVVDYGWFDRIGICWYVGMQEFRTSNILAWQPLPAPYQPKGE